MNPEHKEHARTVRYLTIFLEYLKIIEYQQNVKIPLGVEILIAEAVFHLASQRGYLSAKGQDMEFMIGSDVISDLRSLPPMLPPA